MIVVFISSYPGPRGFGKKQKGQTIEVETDFNRKQRHRLGRSGVRWGGVIEHLYKEGAGVTCPASR